MLPAGEPGSTTRCQFCGTENRYAEAPAAVVVVATEHVAAEPQPKPRSDSALALTSFRTRASTRVVEVRGCDNNVLYSCGYASQHASTRSPWMCMKKGHPDGVAK